MTNRKKPGVTFWATAAVALVLAAYPLSFGPACWLVHSDVLPIGTVANLYRPLISIVNWTPLRIRNWIAWYSGPGESGNSMLFTLGELIADADLFREIVRDSGHLIDNDP